MHRVQNSISPDRIEEERSIPLHAMMQRPSCTCQCFFMANFIRKVQPDFILLNPQIPPSLTEEGRGVICKCASDFRMQDLHF